MTPSLKQIEELIGRLTPNDASVLNAMYEYGADSFYPFAALQAATNLDRRNVRLSCRRLARKGLARFSKGLWTEDGEAAGAGYAITEQASALLSKEEA